MKSLPLKLCENTFNARFRRVYYTKFMYFRLNVYKLNYTVNFNVQQKEP